MGQSSIHDADTENSIVAAIVDLEDINDHEEEESSSKLSLALSELEKSSCPVEVKHKRTEEFCIAAVAPELQEETQGGGQSIKDRQREDPELKLIIDFQEEGVLPSDDKKARELLLSRAQYHMEEGVLYYVETDKALCLIPPAGDSKHLFEEAYSGKFGAHLRDAKVHGELSKHYWWPRMKANISEWCQGCLVCAARQPGRAVQPPLTPIPVEGPFHRVGVDVL